MSDLERVIKFADTVANPSIIGGKRIYNFYPEELLAFEQAVLAKWDEDIESLQAKLAMQADSMEWLWSMVENTTDDERERYQSDLNATQADIDAFMAKKKAEWESETIEKVAMRVWSLLMEEYSKPLDSPAKHNEAFSVITKIRTLKGTL